jgi:hypothetical protein
MRSLFSAANRAMMTAHLSDEALWAVGVSTRLRTLHASFADDDAAARREYLAEEIERAIREVPASRRKLYLEALAERFPEWENKDTTAPEEEAIEAEQPVDHSPASLVAELAAIARGLSDEERRDLAYQLQEAGFAVAVPMPAGAQETEEIPPELQKKLALQPSQTLDRKRVIRLIGVLIDLVVTMDQLAWNVWKNLAPNSRVRRDPGPTGDLRKITGPFLVGDSEVSAAQVTQLLDKTRQLIAGLLAAVGATGETFARQYLIRFSPQSIKEAADAEPGFFIGPEQRCWRKYTQLFNEVSGVTIENEIANAIVKYTEDLILGGGRPPSGGSGSGS